MAAVDWAGLLRACIGGLRMPPETFWALTPFECALLLGGGAPAPMGRGELAALMARWPDATEGASDGR
jgi:uncharacterized phage protein (TIGR02216 family)